MSLRDAAQQAIDALELAGMSHDVMLMSDPPQDAWKARSVSWKLAQAMTALRAALADTQDWNELEALRESLREHMAEIHRLRSVCRQALAELEKEARSADDWLIMMQSARTSLRAALADRQQGTEDGENTMQPTNGVHSRISDCADRGVEAVTDCHDLDQARAVAISNLLAHFGITSANSDVNVAYLHKQLDDLAAAAIGRRKGGGSLPPPLPTLAVHIGYRYQSPVGGWEYGDHLPAGFNATKWAHQKIYILQEQS